MPVATLFSRFLTHLEVPHTKAWTDRQFRDMTFKSLYGLSHLLDSYGVRNEGVKFADKSAIAGLAAPFLAQTRGGIFVIVTRLDPHSRKVQYDSHGAMHEIDLDDFINGWTGIALLAFPDEGSREPDYASHRLTEIVGKMSKYALALVAVALFAHFFCTRQLYAHFSTILLTLFNCAGLYLSYLLLLKSLNIHTAASERVCGVLEPGGCDSIMESEASKLLGVFAWSEIGFGYFGVSLATLLIFPQAWPALAICNLCCLPYTVWSIWYQKYRAGHWCTLCVGVQSTLWLLFFCYACGGWLWEAFPLQYRSLAVLLGCYAFAVLFLNLLLSFFKKLPCHEEDSRA